MSRRIVIESVLPAGLLGLATWLVWFSYHDLLRSYDYVNILGDHFYFLRHNLLRGEIPWWNPYLGLGRPFFTDIHFGTLYPPTYLLLVGERLGAFLLHWSHLILLYFGLCRLTDDLEIHPAIGRVAALFAGLTGCFAARMIIGQMLFTCALCWLPWLLLYTLRLTARWHWPTVTGLTFVLSASFLCGNTNVWWILCIGAGLTFLAREIFEPRTQIWPRFRGRSLQFAAALVFAIGLTTPAWLPYLDLVQHANRMEPTYEFANAFTGRPTDLLSLFAAPSARARFNWENCWFIGALWLFAGVCGAVTTRDARLRAIAATTVFALLYSLGEHTPLHWICYHVLPGASGFRIPSRMAPWAAIGLLLLGASYFSRPADLRRSVPTVGLLLFAMILGLFAARRLTEAPVDALNWITSAQLAVGAAVVILANRLIQRRHLLPCVAGVVTLVEAVVFIHGTKPNYTFEGVMGWAPDFPFTQKLAELPAALGRTPGQPPPRANLPGDLVPANAGMRHGVAMLNSDAPLFPARPWRFLHAATGTPQSTVYRNTLPSAITTRPANELPLVTLNLSRSTTDRGFTAGADSFPRACFTTSARALPDEDAVLKALTGGFPLDRGVLIEGANRPGFGELDQPIRTVPIQSFDNSQLRISLTNQVPGYLVLSEAWFPGWAAVDAGRTLPSEPVNGWMRGFLLAPGAHQLEIRFRPRNFPLGCWIAMATLLFFVAVRSRRVVPSPSAKT